MIAMRKYNNKRVDIFEFITALILTSCGMSGYINKCNRNEWK